MKDSEVLENLPSTLFNVSTKLIGLGELIAFQNREPYVLEKEVQLGIGTIISELGDELLAITKKLDHQEFQITPRKRIRGKK